MLVKVCQESKLQKPGLVFTGGAASQLCRPVLQIQQVVVGPPAALQREPLGVVIFCVREKRPSGSDDIDWSPEALTPASDV